MKAVEKMAAQARDYLDRNKAEEEPAGEQAQ